MRTDEEYNEMTKRAAFRIASVLIEFYDEDPNVRDKLVNITNNRVNRILNGESLIIEGDGLVTEVAEEPSQPEGVEGVETEVVEKPEIADEG